MNYRITFSLNKIKHLKEKRNISPFFDNKQPHELECLNKLKNINMQFLFPNKRLVIHPLDQGVIPNFKA